MNNSFLLALSTLVGTIIGAGIFGLPYVISKSGIVPGVFYFAVLGGAVLLLHLMFGEIALRTAEKHRLIGYAQIYLGDWGKTVVTFSTVFGVVGALLAYIIIGGDFLRIAASPFFSLQSPAWSVVFWAALSVFILRGIQAIAKAELLMNLALFFVVAVIFAFALPRMEIQNFRMFEASQVFLPFGVVLFALAGWAAIPEIADLFKKKKDKKKLDNLIVLASVITVGLYVLFSLVVAGVSGNETSPDALSGLEPFLGKNIVILGALFGLIAIAASFLVLGNYLKNSLRYDFKVPHLLAAGVATLTPLALFLLGFREFIAVIGLVGAFMGAVEGIIIVLIYARAKGKGDREPEYSLRIPVIVLFAAAALFLAGAIAEVATKL